MAKILIVDDDEISATALVLMLEDKGHTVISAGGVREALAAGLKHSPNVLVTDLRLQRDLQGGLTIALGLLELNKQLRIIMYSGASEDERDEVLKVLPQILFLSKPVEPYEIVQAIARQR